MGWVWPAVLTTALVWLILAVAWRLDTWIGRPAAPPREGPAQPSGSDLN